MSAEFSEEDLGDFFIDGKWISYSELTPEQKVRFVREDWAFRLGYDNIHIGLEVTEAEEQVLKDPNLLNYFQRGQASAMDDIKFINPNQN